MNKFRSFLLGILLLVIIPASAIDVNFSFQSGNTIPQGLRFMALYPIGGPYTNGAGQIITRDRITGSTDATGQLIISNIYGLSYRGELQGTSTTTTNYYNFPVTNGYVYAATYAGPPTNAAGLIAYSQAQANSLFLTSTNVYMALLGVATNTFSLRATNVYTLDYTNEIVVAGAGNAGANGTNRIKSRVGSVECYTNLNGLTGIIHNPSDIDVWQITNGLGGELYAGNADPPIGGLNTWFNAGGGLPAPTLTTWGYSTNSFTNLVSFPYNLPWPITQTNILYVSPVGNDYSAVRGDPTRPWKHVSRAWTNMLYQFDVMYLLPGVFDETAELVSLDRLSESPRNCAMVGSGRGVSKVVGTGALARFHFGSSNRVEHLSFETIQIYTGTASHSTNFLCQDVEAHCDGDVWVADSGFLAWDPFIVDCDFSGSSDKIAVLTVGGLVVGGLSNQQTNSRVYIINTRISGGTGADGDGLNRGATTADGVRLGQFVTLGTHVMATGKTNSNFMGLSSQVSTSGTFTATTKMFTPSLNLSGLTASKVVGLNGSKDAASTAATSAQAVAGDLSAITFGSGLTLSGGTLTTNGQTVVNFSYTVPVITVASWSPSGSTTYYFGEDALANGDTTYSLASSKFPHAGTLKAAFLKIRITTTGTGESVTHSVRINDTTDVSIGSATYNANTVEVFSTSLNQSVSAGDTWTIKIVTPAWSGAPATIRLAGWVYVE